MSDEPHFNFKHDQAIQVDQSFLNYLHQLSDETLDVLQNASSQNVIEKEISPGPLPKEGISIECIRHNLMCIIAQREAEDDDNVISYLKPPKKPIDEVENAALFSHTIAAYLSTLNENVACRIGMQIVSDTSLWISKIFRFFDSLAYFSKEGNEGLVRVIRMVLHAKYPKYITLGYEALFTRPPVIYYCDAVSPGLGQTLCTQLGLPHSCLTSVPCYSGATDKQFKMDVSALERCIVDDISAAKTPLLVIAHAGTPLLGYIDNLDEIQEICISHNVWLHVNGHNLAALSLVALTTLPSNVADSMTLNLGDWLGIRSLPFITLYKAKEMAHVCASGLGHTTHGTLDFLPVWVTVQVLGHTNLIQKIQHSFELADLLLEKIENFAELRIISKQKLKTHDGYQFEVSHIGENTIPTMVLFEALTSVIVFQYTPKSIKENNATIEKNPSYYDNLNSWLLQLLVRSVPNIATEILDLENYGVCLRICPLESSHISGASKEDIEIFSTCLEQQISILNATVLQKERLYNDYKSHNKLRVVEIANWAGLGGVRYIPDFWVNRLNELTDSGKADINQLNTDLVNKLRASDTAFSLGEADDGMLCVRFGMVDDKLDMDELINIVISSGQELEESSKFLETMSEMIKHGIEEANKELIQENQEKIMQEGVLRQVPVIGSLFSWWYPPPKETGIKGRSFNLSSGTIESTENIYRYHMQIKEGPKSPPTTTKILKFPISSQVPSDSNNGAKTLPSEK